MPRRVFSSVCLLVGLLLCPTAHSQSQSFPTKINVTGERQLRLGQKTVLQVALLNDQGQEVAAVSDTLITLLATKHKDVRSARAEAEGGDAPGGDSFVLPGDRSTARAVVTIPRGQSRVGVGFASQQAGVVRIYAESEKYATGYAIISVLASRAAAPRERGRDIFVKASYRQGQAPPGDLRIVIEQYNTDFPSIHESTRHWMREFEVMLYSGDLPFAAKQPIKVNLSGTRGRFLPRNEVIIPQGSDRGETTMQLLTDSNADIDVTARPNKLEGLVVGASAPERFDFGSAKVATGLVVETSPSEQPASGRDPIRITVRAVDGGKNTIKCKDEGIAKRDVMLTLDGKSYGVKFENGVASLSITADQFAVEHNIFGFGPVGSAKVIARAQNKLGKDIVGVGEIAFRFPWGLLFCALLGGLCLTVLRTLYRRLRQGKSFAELLPDLPAEAGVDAIVSLVLYIVFFFGAVASAEFNLSGISVILGALPIQHSPPAAFALGFIGTALISKPLLNLLPVGNKPLQESPAS